MDREYRSQRLQFWIILAIVFLGFIGISMPYLIFPPLFLNLDYSFLPAELTHQSRALLLGVTLAAYPLGQFFGSPVLGGLSDDYGRKRLIFWSLILAAVFHFFSGLAIAKQYLSLLIISRFFTGFMEGNIAIARAMCTDLKRLSKQETFGKINASASIAYLVGPLLGAVLADSDLLKELTAATPFFAISALFFGLIGLSSLIPHSPPQGNKTISILQRFNIQKRLKHLLKNRTLKTLLISSTCFTIAVDIFYEFGPVYLTVKWDLNPTDLILYNGVLCVGLAIGNGWLPRIIHSSNRTSISLSLGLFALFLIGIITINASLTTLLLFAISGLVIGLGVTLLTVQISDAAAENIQGEVFGTQLSLRVLGDALICLIGGFLLIFSPGLILLIASAIALLSMAYYRKKRCG